MSEPVDTTAEAVKILRARIGRGLCADPAKRMYDCERGRCLCMGDCDNAIDTLLARLSEQETLLAERNRECDRLREAYQELLFAVGNKYTGETRHQTALRYIRAAEVSGDAAKGAREGE